MDAAPADKLGDVRAAYLENRTIAALTRDHTVSRGAIRTAVADLLPNRTATEEDAPAPEPAVTLDMPGKVTDFLRTAELEPADPSSVASRIASRSVSAMAAKNANSIRPGPAGS
ncbi:hypothetical protein ACQPYK_23780 [Streptosporangium sp. CA-135522]|uniref:hypothetical protein n=1 Tax=Streptosporangium sp. CA-135522 TaxID=3240072 RepID=UPI003D89DE46